MLITKDCTGCGACFAVCPKSCIEMMQDKLGEWKPVINQGKCINCGLCKKTCPQENPLNAKVPEKCYVAWSGSEDDLKKSSSGGFAAVVYKYALSHGIHAYGCDYQEDLVLRHFQIQSDADIEKCRSSKYSQSITYPLYEKIKEQLTRNEYVIYIGTPCQVAGLLSFLKKSYPNLITIDLVCHGTPPNKYLEEYIKQIGKNRFHITKVRFRGEYDQMLALWDENSEIQYLKSQAEDLYFKAFYRNMISMGSCYYCHYAKKERISDITIGDFWGLGDLREITPLSARPSLILINTSKGLTLFNSVQNMLTYEEREVYEGIRGNGRLNRYPGKNKRAKLFDKFYPVMGFKKSVVASNIIYNIGHNLRKVISK